MTTKQTYKDLIEQLWKREIELKRSKEHGDSCFAKHPCSAPACTIKHPCFTKTPSTLELHSIMEEDLFVHDQKLNIKRSALNELDERYPSRIESGARGCLYHGKIHDIVKACGLVSKTRQEFLELIKVLEPLVIIASHNPDEDYLAVQLSVMASLAENERNGRW